MFRESDWEREHGRFARYIGNKGRYTNEAGPGIDIEIDVLTPCLIDTVTGEVLDTAYSKVAKKDLKGLKKKGWGFPWTGKDLYDAEIYKVTIKGDSEIQGLIAIKDLPEDNAVYIHIGEAAPHNRLASRKYEGVGGHLTAIAIQRSLELGHDGFVYFDVKNPKLVSYYSEKFGAKPIGSVGTYRMYVNEAAAEKLVKEYTLERQE